MFDFLDIPGFGDDDDDDDDDIAIADAADDGGVAIDVDGDGIADGMLFSDDTGSVWFESFGEDEEAQALFAMNMPDDEMADDEMADDEMVDDENDDEVQLQAGDDLPQLTDGEIGADGGIGLDLNNNGNIDAVVYVTYKDEDGDGKAESAVIESGIDSNGDGKIDIVEKDTYEDTDDNGIADTLSHTEQEIDDDNDGSFDAHYEIDDEGNVSGIAYSEVYEHFDPEEADMDDIVGDPESAMDGWHIQEESRTCAVAAQEFVLEQLTGEEYEESELLEIAQENGWFISGENGGTSWDDIGNILEYMGMDVERSWGNSISDIEECLENGGAVIVGVDSGELISGDNEEFFGPGNDADHAIQVIGIDRSDPDNPMVIINDSGVADGCGAMVPLDDFVDAWEDSGCFMAEAYA